MSFDHTDSPMSATRRFSRDAIQTVSRRLHIHEPKNPHNHMTAVQKRELRDARNQVRKTAAADANAGYVWEIKVFWLFPLLSKMRNLDHYARVVLPLTYVCYVLVFFSIGAIVAARRVANIPTIRLVSTKQPPRAHHRAGPRVAPLPLTHMVSQGGER